MTGPDLDDDDALDDALRALGTPIAGRPTATAEALLVGAAAAPTVGFGAGAVGLAVLAALGAGGVLGFGVAAAIFAGLGAQEPDPGAPTAGALPRERAAAADERTSEAGERASVPLLRAAVEGSAEATPAPETARQRAAPARGAAQRGEQPGEAAPPGDGGRLPEAAQPGEAEPSSEAVAGAAASLPAPPRAAEPVPRPEVREASTFVRHQAESTYTLGARVTAGGAAWDGTIDGAAPEIAGGIGLVAAGGPVRPRLRADLALGVADARATAAASGLVGLSSDLGPLRFDAGAALGFRWIAARPGAETPWDDEAGWLVLGVGPSAAVVIPRRGADVFFGAEALYSSLFFDGAVRRVPWLGVSAGIEIHGSDRGRLYR